MTREEYVQLAHKTRISSLTVNTGDPLRDTLEEIYWEGYKAGYYRAIDVLHMISPGISSSGSDNFFLHNMNKIEASLEDVGKLLRTNL